MVHVVEAPDLRKVARERFVVVLAVVDRPGPVVAPLDHRARLQPVGTDFVDVFALAQLQLRPVAKC